MSESRGSEPRSVWSLDAACSACAAPLALTGTAVLRRPKWTARRGWVLDGLDDRWPEPGELFHPRCFEQRFGGSPQKTSSGRHGDDPPSLGDAHWRLDVACCHCESPVDSSGAAIVRDQHSPRHWTKVAHLRKLPPGLDQVSHVSCFVRNQGPKAASAALGRGAWKRFSPVVDIAAGGLGQ